MIKKENLSEAWIMVEHLSEGDINLHKSEIRPLDGLLGQDFYSLFLRELSKPRFRTSRKSGVALNCIFKETAPLFIYSFAGFT
ncbi:hypothetical protein DXD97_06985 [Ruminococcus sp. TM10-9AT]|nr:hypothetical protein DXD97_06985 [Ruminococcus sp. TM10-9AT]